MPEFPDDGTWRTGVGTYCPITGLTDEPLFKSLFACGLTALDLVQLEELSNPEVRVRLPKKSFQMFNWKLSIGHRLAKDKVIDAAMYMRAWADLLVERGHEENTIVVQGAGSPAESILAKA